ncbi:TonB-dependent receptor domain-containing protein [Sphingomonas sp. MMS24-JH45]
MPALKVGASAQYQSSFYFEPGTNSVTTGQPIRLTQGSYALLDLMARYDLTERLTLSANVRNVTDTKYPNALTFDQQLHGPPRAVLGTLTVRY